MNAARAQLGWELRRLRKQRSVWLGVAIVVVFETVFAVLLMTPRAMEEMARTLSEFGRTFDVHFTALTLASVLLAAVTTHATPIVLVMMAADIAAGEHTRGTLRTLLCHPVSRTRVLLTKLGAACVFNLGLTLLVAALALALGHALLPRGRMLVVSSLEQINVSYAYADGLLLFTWAAGFLALSNLSASAVGFLASCLPVRPVAAAATALAIIFLESQLRLFPAFRSYWRWFITTRASQWQHVYDPVINWPQLLGDYAVLALFNAAAVALGCWIFARRDLKP